MESKQLYQKIYLKGVQFVKEYNIIAAEIKKIARDLVEAGTTRTDINWDLVPESVESGLYVYKNLDKKAVPFAKLYNQVDQLLWNKEEYELQENLYLKLLDLSEDRNVRALELNGIKLSHLEFLE